MPFTVTYPDDANLDSIYTRFWTNQSLGAFHGTTLAVLDVSDPKHVRIVVPSEELGQFGAPRKGARVRVRAEYERVPSNL